MLDQHAEQVPTVDEIKRLSCSVRLPGAWEDNSRPGGLAPSFPGCKRRFPRFRCYGGKNLVALEHRQTLPSAPRAQEWFAVYLIDVGRGGVGLLHGEPLYPKERLRLVLADGKLRQIEIVRCERVSEDCFRIGARFIAEQASAALSQGA